MKGDFSRSTFRPQNHYRSVRLQQGRVQLDADWNEQADIQAHRDQNATRDIVGPFGAPLHKAGFALSVGNNGLRIGAGRYYLDGLLCENEGDVDFEDQPDQPGARLPADPPGTYLAYLDTWKRHITVVEDPSLREVALGGPDTTTREKTVWQVRLQQVDGDEVRKGFGQHWTPRNTRSTGLLSARAKPGVDSDGSATTPPGAGYRRLENQLYRVEIHEGGDPVGSPRSGALTRVQGIAGTEVQVVNDGRLWQAGEMVELFGDAASTAPGTLARIVAVDERPQSGTSAGLRAVDFGYPNAPYALGDDATILASKDGGANWAVQDPPEGVTASLHGTYFSGSNGWAVGDGATILATKDGGTTWVEQDPPQDVTASLRAICFSGSSGLAVGDDATILASKDGGANWAVQDPPEGVTANLHGVYLSDSRGLAVGDDAVVLATEDGGTTWTAQGPPEGVTASLHGVYLSGSNGWAVGDGATILATEDGGASWAEQQPPQGATTNLRAVHFVYSLADSKAPPQGWAVGDGATILATEDGGASWVEQEPPRGVTANLHGVRFSGSNGWAVGDDATILASKDGGTTWTHQTTRVLTLEKDVSGIEPQPTRLRRVATFKFSRDNGTVLTQLEEINGDLITVSDPGRDSTLGFADGHWVELSDEERVLRGEPGILVQLASVEGNDLTVDRWPDDTPLTRSDFGRLPTVRRWDSERSIPVTTGSWLDLENGVQVQFALDGSDKEAQATDDEFHTGDYWMIPARSLTGDVEWPKGGPGSQTPAQPVFEPRHGIEHHYCPLALLELKDRAWSLVSDYRKLFPPVTELTGSGIRVAGIFLESTGQALGPELAVTDLASGIRVACETKIDPNLANGKHLCSVTLDMPFPSNDQDRQIWGGNVIGVSPLTLSADEEISDEKTIVWKPSQNTQPWLQTTLPQTMRARFQQDRMLAHLTLRGSDFETWFSLVFERVTETRIGFIPNLEPADGRGYPFANPRVLSLLREALSLAIDRASLSEALPPGYSVDESLDFNPEQARRTISILRDGDPNFDPFWLVLIQRRLFEDEERLFSLSNLLFGMLQNVGIEPFEWHTVGDVGDTENEKGVEEVGFYLRAFDFAPLVVIGDKTFAEDLAAAFQDLQRFDGDLLIHF